MSNPSSIANFYPHFVAESNSCVSMMVSGDGSNADPFAYEAVVEISDDSGNTLECREDGLYCGISSSGLLFANSTESVETVASGNGSPSSPYYIQSNVVISPDVGNALAVRPNGLYSTAGSGGGGYIQVNDTPCLDFTVAGSGVAADPYIISAAPILSPDAENALECRANGMYVPNMRDVYVHQGAGLAPPNPAVYSLWVDGTGRMLNSGSSRTSWNGLNHFVRPVKTLSIVNGVVTIPYRDYYASSGVGVTHDQDQYKLTVNSNITNWLTTDAQNAPWRMTFRIVLLYDGTPRTITWPTSWKWARKPTGWVKVPPAPTATMDIVVWGFSDDGGVTQYADWNYYGTAANQP